MASLTTPILRLVRPAFAGAAQTSATSSSNSSLSHCALRGRVAGIPSRCSGSRLRLRIRCGDDGGATAGRQWRTNAGAEGKRIPESEEELLSSRDAVAASVDSSTPLPLPERIALFYDAFWRFLRPHTIRGTFLGTTALVTRALLENPSLINWALLPKALRGLLALLCGNGFIVGINQIYDSGIDKVNKPFLPIAAGDLSVPAAWALVVGLAALGLGIVATNFGPLITKLYSFGLLLGTIYSVPPFRLKQHPVPAFLIIATVRGFLLNFGVYYATRAALGLSYEWSPSVIFITVFVTVFATVIAITKDLPDIEGDKKFNISTFATKMGVRRISFLGAGLLLANYVGAIVAGFYLRHVFKRNVMVAGHAVLGLCLVYQTWLLETGKYSKEAIADNLTAHLESFKHLDGYQTRAVKKVKLDTTFDYDTILALYQTMEHIEQNEWCTLWSICFYRFFRWGSRQLLGVLSACECPFEQTLSLIKHVLIVQESRTK